MHEHRAGRTGGQDIHRLGHRKLGQLSPMRESAPGREPHSSARKSPFPVPVGPLRVRRTMRRTRALWIGPLTRRKPLPVADRPRSAAPPLGDCCQTARLIKARYNFYEGSSSRNLFFVQRGFGLNPSLPKMTLPALVGCAASSRMTVAQSLVVRPSPL